MSTNDVTMVSLQSIHDGRRYTFDLPASLLGGRYVAFDAIRFVGPTEDGPPLLGFAATGYQGVLALNVRAGHVVEVHAAGEVTFVNSSLDAFASTVEAIHARFPFYSRAASDDEFDAAADDLLQIIHEIDPAAVMADQFWSTFVDDVRMGDFSTEDVQALRGDARP